MILIVEDEVKLAQSIADGLGSENFKVEICHSTEDALFNLSQSNYDLILLDVNLPGRSGFELLQRIRSKNSNIKVLMLTARDGIDDRIHGLTSGADDYLTKPFAFAELVARVKILLKRGNFDTVVKIKVCDLEIDLLTREIRRGGVQIDLTLKEFALLEYLVRHRNEVVSREMLAKDVWKESSRATPIDNIIDVHVARLRKKIDQSDQPVLIHTVRGVGFIIRGQ